MRRERTHLPKDIYPDDPWAIVERRWSPDLLYLTETIFALSNGNLGVRGSLEEGAPSHSPGTFVNGFHETWPIHHPEMAFGLAITGQTIVNVPDSTLIEILVAGEPLRPEDAVEFARRLDFRTGLLRRNTRWRLPEGGYITVESVRLVSLTRSDTMAIDMTILADTAIDVEIRSLILDREDAPEAGETDGISDPRRAARSESRVLNPVAATFEETRVTQSWSTTHSQLSLVTAIDHVLSDPAKEFTHVRDTDRVGVVFQVRLTPGMPFRLTKWAVYHREREQAEASLDRAVADGFAAVALHQEEHLRSFWDKADIEVETEEREIQRAIRWTLFQLHQASACLNGHSIPAKGLTGQAYDGHYFWDTEIYVLPALAAFDPPAAAEILRFRHRLLPAARQRAHDLAERGALYPWRTINGEEASAYFLAGTAQYHIDADIIYALKTYVAMTGDEELLWEIGVEMAVETARMWAGLGFFREGVFHIHGVTGPDEYTALVDDNAYTNLMARMNLRYAARVVEEMRVRQPERFAALASSLGLLDSEPSDWLEAARAMFVPYDEERGITPQDADFLDKEPWDFAGTPSSRYPLLLHFHPLVIYRFQVLKQADVVLATFLLGESFTADLKRRNFEFYDAITTGDSSLSACVQAIMAAEVGRPELAWEHFDRALFMDLADLAGNTTDGVHMASAGGVWLALVAGFGGMRIGDDRIVFDPRLPDRWKSLRFSTRYGGHRISVHLDTHTIRLRSDGDVTVEVAGRDVQLTAGQPVTVEL